jgi:hypothetical protein
VGFDAVYPLGSGSRFGNDEIRYSVRSLLHHCKDLDRIWIVGAKPEFFRYSDRLRHIPFTENGHGPAYHGWHKAMTAARHSETSERFLLMYDDLFITEDFRIANLPHFARASNSTRQPSVRNAFKELKKAGRPLVNYATHLPVTLDKAELLEIDRIYGKVNGLSLRVMVGNYFRKKPTAGNARTVRRVPNAQFLDRVAEGRVAIETRSRAEWSKIKPWMEQRYPKAEFEV